MLNLPCTNTSTRATTRYAVRERLSALLNWFFLTPYALASCPLAESWRAINLIACPNLNALTLRLHLGAKQGTRSEPKHPPSAAIAELLARAPPSLTTVSIEVLGARDSDAWLDEPQQPLRHLHALDVLLASSARFPALRHVRCRLHGSYLSRALANAAKEAFENVQGRGMLEVVKG